MTSRRRSLAIIMLAAAVYAPREAAANGRFPRAQQIVSVPGDPSRIFLRATFGIVASFDGGKEWRWLCEEALGITGTWDPPVAASPDGKLWVGLIDGLAWTTDACTVHTVPELAGDLVSDVSTSGRDLIVATASPKKPGAVWRITNGVPRKTLAAPEGFYIDTIDSLGKRVYVTGIHQGERPTPNLFRSDDGGAFQVLTPTWPTKGRLYLAAIDPKNSSRIFVRQLSDRGSDLLSSDDAGATFKLVLHMAGAMFGFAQSADGATLWAGSGDASEGLFRSIDRGRTFAPVSKAPIFCLHRTAAQLLSCSNPFTRDGYALGASLDDGLTLSPLIGFADIRGPVTCDAGAALACEKSWTTMHATLTTKTAAPQSPSSPPPRASSSADASALPATPARSSCGCDVTPSDHAGAKSLFVLALAALVRRRDGSRARARPGSAAPQ